MPDRALTTTTERDIRRQTSRRDRGRRRELPDGTELDVRVITSELVRGDQPGNVEWIEQWWDFESGLLIYESRSYDFTLETPLGDAEYLEECEAVLPSLTPVS